MPLPNPNYVAMFPLQEQIWDKDLNVPLAAGYILFFEDEARTVPKDVFVQTQTPGPTYSYTNIGSQVTLSSIGTTQYLGTDTIIFLFPFDAMQETQLYYIEVYSSTDVLQFTRSAWPPGAASGSGSAGFTQSQNIVSNPQFSEVLFNTSLGVTISVSGTMTTPIAPDWDIITTGTGTVTLNQIALTDALAPGSPAYALDITSASINSLILNQRITNSPRILENTFASGTFIVEARSPTVSTPITMNYVPSLGAIVPIVVGNASAGGFTVVAGTTDVVIPQTNTNAPGSTGYVDIQLVLAVGAHIRLSCVQLVSVATAATIADYVQESVPRQIDHLFHYYNPQLQFKPIPSWLVGWDFPLNPAQFGATVASATVGNGKSRYIWDQTIVYTTVDNAVSYSRDPNTNGLKIATSSASSFAIIQYLTASQAREILFNTSSVQMRGATSSTLNGTVSLWWTDDASLPDLTAGNNYSLVSSITAGVPTVGGGGNYGNWTQVTRSVGKNAPFTFTATELDYSFNSFDFDEDGQTTATFFAIVVTFDTMADTDILILDYISLVSGDIATRPAPQQPDEVLRECQYYYEKSWEPSTALCPGNSINSMVFYQGSSDGGSTSTMFQEIFSWNYKQTKISILPVITLYSAGNANTSAVVTGVIEGRNTVPASRTIAGDISWASFWTVNGLGSQAASYVPTVDNLNNVPLSLTAGTGTLSVTAAYITFHYTVDARLGLVD